jgi:hypothetical protein
VQNTLASGPILAHERLLVVCNFYGTAVDYALPVDAIPAGWQAEALLGTSAPPHDRLELEPYAARVWRLRPHQN